MRWGSWWRSRAVADALGLVVAFEGGCRAHPHSWTAVGASDAADQATGDR